MMGRAVRLAGSALLSVLFTLPLLSVFLNGGISPVAKLMVAAIALLAATATSIALVIITALLPLALGLQILFGEPLLAEAWTESLMFAFLAGAAWRVGVRTPGTTERLSRPALLLAAIILCSAVVDLAALQVSDLSQPVVSRLWTHVLGEYAVGERPFLALHEAWRWLGALALCVFVERTLRKRPDLVPVVTRVWLAGGAAAASFAIARIVQVTTSGKVGPPLEALRYIVENVRISALHPDLNAAGSYFVLLLVAAVVMGVAGRLVWVLALVLPMVAIAFLAAQSRSAVAAMFIVLAAALLMRVATSRRLMVGAVVIVALAAGGLVIWMTTSSAHATPSLALQIRGDLNRVTMRMARDYPVFGVGLTRYQPMSTRYFTSDMVTAQYMRAGENAHNNFFQVLGELGIPAFLVFVWLVLGVLVPWRPERGAGSPWGLEASAIAAGVAAFLISALFGHPLLITQVLVAFFLALGLAAGAAPSRPSNNGVGRYVTAGGLGVLLLLLPWRVNAVYTQDADFGGLSAIAGELDGVPYQRAESRAFWRIANRAQAVTLPLRWAADGAVDCEVTLWFDGRVADRVRPRADAWLPVRFDFHPDIARAERRQLQVQVSDGRCQLLAGPIEVQ